MTHFDLTQEFGGKISLYFDWSLALASLVIWFLIGQLDVTAANFEHFLRSKYRLSKLAAFVLHALEYRFLNLGFLQFSMLDIYYFDYKRTDVC